MMKAQCFLFNVRGDTKKKFEREKDVRHKRVENDDDRGLTQ